MGFKFRALGTWVAPLVECLTLDFGLGYDLWVMRMRLPFIFYFYFFAECMSFIDWVPSLDATLDS